MDESIMEVEVQKSLTMREHQWELIKQLILDLGSLAKSTKIMKTKLENDFKLLSGPHYQGAKSKRSGMSNSDELCDYQQLAYIPTMGTQCRQFPPI